MGDPVFPTSGKRVVPCLGKYPTGKEDLTVNGRENYMVRDETLTVALFL